MKAELEPIRDKLGQQWCDSLTVYERDGRLHVSTSFVFDDGDALPIVVDFNRANGKWTLSDDGRATSHHEYGDFTVTDRRQRRIGLMVENWGGRYERDMIVADLDAPPDAFDIADFLQLVAAITALPLQESPARKPNFRTIVRGTVESWLPPDVERQEAFTERSWDPWGVFPVDLRIWRENSLPVDSFFVANREPIDHVIGTLWHLRSHDVESHRLVVHRTRESSSSLYRLDSAARETGAQLVAVRGEPRTMTAMLGVRRALVDLEIPLLN